MEPKKLFSLCAGEMWARTSSSMRRGRPHRLHGQALVISCPGHDGVGDQRESPCLLGLLFEVAGADGALVGVENVPFERVQRLAPVELAGDLAAIRRVRQALSGVRQLLEHASQPGKVGHDSDRLDEIADIYGAPVTPPPG
jgi:hypothetical protein